MPISTSHVSISAYTGCSKRMDPKKGDLPRDMEPQKTRNKTPQKMCLCLAADLHSPWQVACAGQQPVVDGGTSGSGAAASGHWNGHPHARLWRWKRGLKQGVGWGDTPSP